MSATAGGPASMDAGPPVLELDAALARFGGQRALLTKVAQAFVQANAGLPAQSAAHADASELDALGEIGHRIKGAATLLGALRLATAAAALENGQRDGDLACLPALTQTFIEELEHALAALRALAPGTPAPAPAPAIEPDSARRAHALTLAQRLIPLLRDGDYAATDLLDQLDQSLGNGAHGKRLAAIRARFTALDTDDAAALAELLARELGPA